MESGAGDVMRLAMRLAMRIGNGTGKMHDWRDARDWLDATGNATGNCLATGRAMAQASARRTARLSDRGMRIASRLRRSEGLCRELQHEDRRKLMEEMKTASYPANRGTTVRRDRYEWAETRGDLGRGARERAESAHLASGRAGAGAGKA